MKSMEVEIFKTGVFAPIGAGIKTKVRCLVDAGWHKVELKRIYEYGELRGMLAINTKEFHRLVGLCGETMSAEEYAPFMVDFFSDDVGALNKIFVFKQEKWQRG